MDLRKAIVENLDGSQYDIALDDFGLTDLGEDVNVLSDDTNSTSDNISEEKFEDDNTNEQSKEVGVDMPEENVDSTEISATKEWIPNVLHENTPFQGMTFQSDQNAYDFYNLYARMGGFDVRWATSKKRRGELFYRWIVCSKEGFKKPQIDSNKTYVTKRCGCRAKMVIIKCTVLEIWKVQSIYYGHNHDMLSPSKMNMHNSKRRLLSPQKKALNVLLESGMRPTEAMKLLATEANGIQNVSFSIRQIYAQQRHNTQRYKGKDFQLTLDYFNKKKQMDQDFYFSFEIDEDNQVGNILWIDGQSREDYHYFGDVVSFDTTYKVNKYLMSFAPFVGVNHHNQSIIFGCALLVNESADSFKWIFREWLNAMNDCPPLSIITDQDLGMKNAIKEVFSNTVHRFCTWHIKQKVPKNLKTLYKMNSDFKRLWDAWFHKSSSIEEFESNWGNLIALYPALIRSRFATDLWEERQLWFSGYTPNTFMAGMSSTQRSESMNSFFKKWVNKDTPLHVFVKRFENALEARRFAEKEADTNMVKGELSLSTRAPLERFLRDTFTPAIFSKMKVQYLSTIECFVQLERDGPIRMYKGRQRISNDQVEEFHMEFDRNNKEMSSCKCKFWENSGIICCHMFSILLFEDINELPCKYILKRWTRRAKIGATYRLGPSQVTNNLYNSFVLKKQLLQLKANKCVIDALRCDATTDEAMLWFEELSKKIEEHNLKQMNPSAPSIVGPSTNEELTSDLLVKDLAPVNAKGSGKRLKSHIEKNKRTRTCESCGCKGHDSRTCCLSITSSNAIGPNCPSKGARKCHFCEGTGHDKRNCPNRNTTG